MKRQLTTILVAMMALMFAANAQTLDATSYPENMSAYCPAINGTELYVNYDLPLYASGDIVATLWIGNSYYRLEGIATAESYSIVFPLADVLEDAEIDNRTSFRVEIPAVTLAYLTYDGYMDDSGYWHQTVHVDSTAMSNTLTLNFMYLEFMPVYTFTPAAGVVAATDFTLTISSTIPVDCQEISYTSGSWFAPTISTENVDYSNARTITGHVYGTRWDLTTLPATLTVEAALTIDGYALPEATVNYQFGQAPAATFTGTNPDPTYCDAADLNNDYWMMNFLFSGEVTLNENLPYSAVVEFYDANGLMQNETIEVPTMNMWAGEDFWNGGYSVDVPTYPMPANAISVTYTLIGVSNVDGVFDPQPSVTYYVQQSDQQQQSAPRSAQLGVSNGRVDVYSIKTGAMVRSQMQLNDVKNLPTGIYIIKQGESTSKIFVR